MQTTQMPYVAVIGGLWNITDVKVKETAKAAGRDLGVELAKAGFGLVVYFSDEDSLEPHVVSGYATVATAEKSIRVRYAESQRDDVKFQEQSTKRELFDRKLFPGRDWEAPFYRSIAEEEGVDAVVLLGGAASTLIAGQIAMARRLPLLAVDQFGGSAAKIWNQLAQAAPNGDLPSWQDHPVSYLVDQLKKSCAVVAARRQDARRRERLIAVVTMQEKKIPYAACSFLVLLAALVLGTVHTPAVWSYPLVIFCGLVASGATGALVRALMWRPRESDPRISLLLGCIAGFVVGLAYLIPQFVGAPGVLAPKADVVSATDKIQFISAVLVAISAGVGFDTVFGRLRTEAQTLPIKADH